MGVYQVKDAITLSSVSNHLGKLFSRDLGKISMFVTIPICYNFYVNYAKEFIIR